MNPQRFVLTAVGPDQPGIVARLSGFLTEHAFNLEDSRMATLGGEFALILLVSTTQSDPIDLRMWAAHLETLTGMSVTVRETTQTGSRPGIPFLVRGYAMDYPGIVHALAHEIASLGANIEEMETSMQPAPVSGTPLFDVKLRISLPPSVSITDLRRRLADVADKRNMDISVEPSA